MDVLMFATLVVTGFTSCAEFGSYAFVHPVIKRLDRADHIAVEKGLVQTFGRIMPVIMTLSLVLLISSAVANSAATPRGVLGWTSVAVWAFGLTTTAMVNVGINSATARWDTAAPPDDWKQVRDRWERFQAIRSWAFLIAWIVFCVAVALR